MDTYNKYFMNKECIRGYITTNKNNYSLNALIIDQEKY